MGQKGFVGIMKDGIKSNSRLVNNHVIDHISTGAPLKNFPASCCIRPNSLYCSFFLANLPRSLRLLFLKRFVVLDNEFYFAIYCAINGRIKQLFGIINTKTIFI